MTPPRETAMATTTRQQAPLPAIDGTAEAEQVCAHFGEVMDTLLGVLDEETRLVRAGRLRDAAGLAASKQELARLYLADVERVKRCGSYLTQRSPAVLARLRERHDTFRALLQINLTVLATAHAVSEGLIRGVSNEIARKTAPQTYGASGRANAPGPSAARPLAVSRRL